MKLRAKNLRTAEIIDPAVLDTLPLTDGSGRRMVTHDVYFEMRKLVDVDGKIDGKPVTVPEPVNIAIINANGEVIPQPGYDVIAEDE